MNINELQRERIDAIVAGVWGRYEERTVMKANYDQVICPNCVHQFQAVPVNTQGRITDLEAQLAAVTADRDALEQSLIQCGKNGLEWRTKLAAMAAERDKQDKIIDRLNRREKKHHALVIASQAREAKLREALEVILADNVLGAAMEYAVKHILTTPINDTALKQYGAKLLRDLANNDCIYDGVGRIHRSKLRERADELEKS